MPVFRLVVSLPVSCGEEFLFIPSRPALRAAACAAVLAPATTRQEPGTGRTQQPP
jgi:hypothetical protein